MLSQLAHNTEPSRVRLCPGCELPVDVIAVKQGKTAYCPRCGSELYRGGRPTLSGNLAIALTCLLLFIPSHFFNFLSIRLFGQMIPATLFTGVSTLFNEGYIFLSLLVAFCSSLAPLLVCGSVVTAHIAMHTHSFKLLKRSLWIVHHLKHWVMIDVFLISVAISCFKLQDYSDIHVGTGLYGLVLLQLFTVLLVTRVNIRRYWEGYKHESEFPFEHKDIQCATCHLSQPNAPYCVRCETTLAHRTPNSIAKTWGYLVAASIAIIPANLIPISILLTNGKRLEDTIFSGVAALIKNGMSGIAIIIFVASIVVPVAKILGLSYILLAVKFKRRIFHRQRMTIYFVVKWIGKWSMMDLFVISIMMSLVDRGQILDFTPGYGAVAFGIVVVLTMLAADSFDPRFIWENYNQSNSSKTTPTQQEPFNE